MLKHTPKYQLVSQATTLQTTLGGSKKRCPFQQIQINLAKKPDSIASDVELFYYSQVHLISLPNRLMDQQYHLSIGVVRKWLLCYVLHFGILFSTKNGTS